MSQEYRKHDTCIHTRSKLSAQQDKFYENREKVSPRKSKRAWHDFEYTRLGRTQIRLHCGVQEEESIRKHRMKLMYTKILLGRCWQFKEISTDWSATGVIYLTTGLVRCFHSEIEAVLPKSILRIVYSKMEEGGMDIKTSKARHEFARTVDLMVSNCSDITIVSRWKLLSLSRSYLPSQNKTKGENSGSLSSRCEIWHLQHFQID